jgi:hypothetical protein
VTALPSPAGDGPAEAMLVVAHCRCRGDFGRDVMLLPSNVSEVAAEATWSWRDVSVELCYAIGVGIYYRSRDV